MSKLNFTPVNQAFTLGSTQRKDIQDEISHLTKIILESNASAKTSSKRKSNSPSDSLSPSELTTPIKPPPVFGNQQPFYDQNTAGNFKYIGYPDQQTAVFKQRGNEDNFDYNLMKIIGHPRFDDIVTNYAIVKHPEWFLSQSVYTPNNLNNLNVPNNLNFNAPSDCNVSYFGNRYQSTLCSDVKNYIFFFVVCMALFLVLSLYFK